MGRSFIVHTGDDGSVGEGGRHLLLHAHRSEWVRVNDTGLEIASALDDGVSVEELVRRFVSKYGIGEDVARQDILTVQKELKAGHFFEAEAPETPRTRTLRSLFLQLTNRCNLTCPHCYVSSPDQGRCEPVDLETGPVMSMIDELHSLGGTSVMFSGGEPLLHLGLKDLVRHAAAKLNVSILSNGTLIDRAWASFLAEHEVRIQISLDGSCAEIHDQHRGKGSFERALRGLSLLKEAGLGEHLNICTTLMSQNVNDLKDIIRLVERLGIPLLRVIPLRREGCARNEWEELSSGIDLERQEEFFRYVAELREEGSVTCNITCGVSGYLFKITPSLSDDDIWCPAGSQIVVDDRGEAYPCAILMTEEFRLGNALETSLADLSRSEGMAHTCDVLVGRRTGAEECRSCSWRNLCQGGCVGLALDREGTVMAPDPYCSYRRECYKKAIARLFSH